VFIAGDFNGSGFVDAADYNYWRTTFASINSLAADGSNNGVVDASDYVLWRKHVGSPGSGASVAIPEPTGRLSMLCAGIILFFVAEFGRLTPTKRLRTER
jgi:hypothetical protein